MVFETEKKASNFIKFNKDEVEKENTSLRAYYCEGCGEWHITSHKYKKYYDTQLDSLMQAYEFSKKAKNMFRDRVKTCLILFQNLW